MTKICPDPYGTGMAGQPMVSCSQAALEYSMTQLFGSGLSEMCLPAECMDFPTLSINTKKLYELAKGMMCTIVVYQELCTIICRRIFARMSSGSFRA